VKEAFRMTSSRFFNCRSSLVFVTLFCSLSVALGFAQDESSDETSKQPPVETKRSATPEWKIAVGQKLKYVRSIERRVKISADAPEQVINRSVHVTLHATERLPDGSIRIEETIDRLCVKKDNPAVNFDSARDEIPLQYQVIVGRTFSFSIDRLGRVSNIRLESEGPELPDQLKQALSTIEKPSTWKNFIPRLPFPEGIVSKGQTWKSESKMEGSPVGDTISTVTHRFLGVEKMDDSQIANIGLTAVYTQKGKISDAIPMTLKKMTGGAKGDAQFDVSRGRLVTWTINERTVLEAEVYGKAVTVVTTGTQRWQYAD